jgi:signal transduction histidine kinase
LKENFAALGEMSAGITHEFKNALATISGYAQLLERESDPERARDHAREIVSDTRRLTRVVSEFLQFARPVDLGLKSVAVHDVLADAIEELGRQRPSTHRIEFVSATPAIIVQADQTLLVQAILNVLINAVEARGSAPGGPESAIRVSLEFVPGPSGAESGRVHIAICDDGPGITPEILDKLVVPFFTTKPGGSGLGLSLVEKIAIAHGGAFEIRNGAGQGAEAVLSLPAVVSQIRTEMEPSGFRPE